MIGETYEEFVEKFKPKKTTDDCYTPPKVYEAVKNWACKEYGIDENKIVRPFYPGGDYENFDYPKGAVVLDNPPFSILTKIMDFYIERGIKFFLFAPELTIISSAGKRQANIIAQDSQIIYENGASVKTCFVTSFDEYKIRTAPELGKAIKKSQENKNELPKYSYPDHVITISDISKIAKHGVDFKLKAEDVCFIRGLDSQKPHKKTIYGSGFLLSERAVAERAVAERAVAERAVAERENKIVWGLSKREREIIKSMM